MVQASAPQCSQEIILGWSNNQIHSHRNQQQKFRKRETKHLSTNADSCTDTKNNPASKAKFLENLTFFARQFYTLMWKSIQIWQHFFQYVFPNDSENITSLDIGLLLFFFITLLIPRPLRSGINWPINFAKKIDNFVYFQQKKCKTEEKGRVPEKLVKIFLLKIYRNIISFW